MKPFNLQEALAGKPVVSVNGAKVTKLVHLPGARSSKERVVVLFETGCVVFYKEDGTNPDNTGSESVDLRMASEKKEGWMNLYRRGTSEVYPGTTIFDSLEKAKNAANGAGSVTTIKISWEE